MCITFLSTARRVPLSFQESRVVNRENTYNLVTSPLIQIELKSFLGFVERYLLVFVDVAIYKAKFSSPLFKNVMYRGRLGKEGICKKEGPLMTRKALA
jgi:hypothetical protein